MQLADLFTNLSYGRLQNTAAGGEGSGTIPAEHETRLTTYVNQSLTALYARFPLLEKELVIQAQDEQVTYYLHKKHALTDASAAPKYIRDTASDPFLGDVLKVLAAFNELGEQLGLNDPKDPLALFTPKYDAIQIPGPVTGNDYFILYQADHPRLVPGDLTQEVMVPAYLEEALQAHVAAKVFSGISGEANLAKGQMLMAEYEQFCQDTESRDLASTSITVSTTKLDERGFV